MCRRSCYKCRYHFTLFVQWHYAFVQLDRLHSPFLKPLHASGYRRRLNERIAHDHRDPVHPRPIVRRAQQRKLFLTLDSMEWRLEYSEWALAKLNKGAIFIFSD